MSATENAGATRRRAITGVLACGALVVLFFSAWRGAGSSRAPAEPPSRADAIAGGPHADEPTRAAPAQSVTVTPHGPAALPAAGAPSLAVLQQSLADYLAVSAYPPWSHPHSEGTA